MTHTTLCNDISINTSYKIENNNVILNVELSCEYSTPIHVFMSKFINETEYDYRTVTKEILTKANKHKFNFEICFNDVDNNEYGIYIYDYYIIIDCFHLTVNYTHVNETGIDDIINDVNETVNVSDIVKSNVSGIYNGSNVDGNSNNGTDNNSDLNENSNDSNSHKSHKSDVGDFRKVISSFGDLISSADSISSEDANSYELIRKSALKSSNNIFSNFIIMILLFIAFMVGFLMFKREY